MSVSPRSATINALPPFGGAASGFVTSIKLTATVIMSDGRVNQSAEVTWSSADTRRAIVAQDGTVTAPTTASPGTVRITATVSGTELSDFSTITVTTDGKIHVIVE